MDKSGLTLKQWLAEQRSNPNSLHSLSPEEFALAHKRGIEFVNKYGGIVTKKFTCPHLMDRIASRDNIPMTVLCGCIGQEREIKLPIHRCQLKGRCVPITTLTKKQLKQWTTEYDERGEEIGVRIESELYQLCQLCQHNPEKSEKPD